jgi:hypothetical protein
MMTPRPSSRGVRKCVHAARRYSRARSSGSGLGRGSWRRSRVVGGAAPAAPGPWRPGRGPAALAAGRSGAGCGGRVLAAPGRGRSAGAWGKGYGTGSAVGCGCGFAANGHLPISAPHRLVLAALRRSTANHVGGLTAAHLQRGERLHIQTSSSKTPRRPRSFRDDNRRASVSVSRIPTDCGRTRTRRRTGRPRRGYRCCSGHHRRLVSTAVAGRGMRGRSAAGDCLSRPAQGCGLSLAPPCSGLRQVPTADAGRPDSTSTLGRRSASTADTPAG